MLLFSCTPDELSGDQPHVEVPADVTDEPVHVTSVGVVLPPADAFSDAVIDAMRRDVGVVTATTRPDVATIRTLVPDEQVFVDDLIHHLTAQGTSLVCVLSTGALSTIRLAYETAPQQRFCGLATSELTAIEPDHVDVVVLRTTELGFVVGTAAAAATRSGQVVLALAPHDLEQGRFHDGLLAALTGVEVIAPVIDADLVDHVERAIDDGADVVVVGGGADAQRIADAAVARGARLVLEEPVAPNVDDAQVVMRWRILWNRVLRGPLDRLLEREQPATMSLGISEGVFVFDVSSFAPAGVNAAVTRTAREIADGERNPAVSDGSPNIDPNTEVGQ